MAKKSRRSTGNPYHLLQLVPKRAIVDRLLTHPGDQAAVLPAMRSVRRSARTATREQLISCSVAQLIEVFGRCTATTEDDARALHDEWRYRGMKSLFLYRFSGGDARRPGLLDRLNNALAQLTPDAASELEDKFEFEHVDSVAIDGDPLWEIRYRYVAQIAYVDPDDEDAKVVHDLRNGFAWIAPNRGWAAVAAGDLDTRDRVASCLQTATGSTVLGLRFSKNLVQSLEADGRRRRVALVDPDTGTTRRLTGRRLGSDTSAQTEIRQRMRRDDAPFSGYDVQVDRNTTMVLGYNNRQGKIFFSKDLTVDQLRAWGPAKIGDVLQATDQAIRERPTFKQEVVDEYLRTLPTHARPAARDLAMTLAACKSGEMSEEQLTVRPAELRDGLGKHVTASLYPLRDDTEEVADVQCSSCDSENLGLSARADSVKCLDCGQRLNHRRLPAGNGVTLRFSRLDDIVRLTPSNELRESVLKAAAAITGLPINLEEEFFYVLGNTLVYRRLTGDGVLAIDDIPEFRALLDDGVSTQRQKTISVALAQYKEKCDEMSTGNCARCVNDRVGEKCFLRLFGLLDSTFTPRPHTGNEYGDYHKFVTIGGAANQALVVPMKSMPCGDGEVTAASKAGRELLQQTISHLRNTGVAAVGISIPRRLHGDFRQTLIDQAKSHGKRLVFIDDVTMIRIVSTVLTRRRMRLADL